MSRSSVASRVLALAVATTAGLTSLILAAGAARAEEPSFRDIVRAHHERMAARLGLPTSAAAQLDGPRIIGGTLAPASRYRFQVGLLQASNPNNFSAQFCGGTLFEAQWVITAAHCVDFLTGPSQLAILTGTADLASGGTRRSVSKIIIHPGWTPSTFNQDIALIKLTAPATGVRRVKLILKSQESSLAGTGDPARTVGWGDTNPGLGQTFPEKLHHVLIAILSRAQCNAATSYAGAVTTRMVCAGVLAGGKDSCQGDSGGPLIVAGSNGKFDVQAGIVSWGRGCAQPNLPGLYTRLAVYRNWIASKIASN